MSKATPGTAQPPAKVQQAPSEPQKQPDAKPDDKKPPESSAVGPAGISKESSDKKQGTISVSETAKGSEQETTKNQAEESKGGTRPHTEGAVEQRPAETAAKPESPRPVIPSAGEQEALLKSSSLADRDALLKKGYTPKLVSPEMSNGGKKRVWKIGESSSFQFVDVPASIRERKGELLCTLKPSQEGNTSRLDIEVPSTGTSVLSVSKRLLSCRLKGEGTARWLEAELDAGVTEENYGDYLKWLVIEVADDKKHIYQCRLGPENHKTETKKLGYSENGPLPVDPVDFHYPWSDLLVLQVGSEKRNLPQMGKKMSFLIPVSGDADGHKDEIKLKVEVETRPAHKNLGNRSRIYGQQ